jgi:predicted nucleic acid-binding protein
MICLDASLVGKLLLDEADSARARAFYRAAIQADERMVAPHLLASEITNMLRQRMRRGQQRLSLVEAVQLLRRILSLPLELLTPVSLYELALTLADSHNLPAAYDAHYLALAQQLGCSLWTADERLANAVAGRLPFVKWIGNYAEGDPL